MPGEEGMQSQVSEQLANIASAVPSPFNEQDTSTASAEYFCTAKTIGERLAAGVVFGNKEPAPTLSTLLEEISETAEAMLPPHNPNRTRFLNDETAVAYAMHVYQACVFNPPAVI